jgi:hypothetical protein
MSEVHLTRKSYTKLIYQDIDWLIQNTRSGIERAHIIQVLKDSINLYYGDPKETPSEEVNTGIGNGLIISIDKGHGTGL